MDNPSDLQDGQTFSTALDESTNPEPLPAPSEEASKSPNEAETAETSESPLLDDPSGPSADAQDPAPPPLDPAPPTDPVDNEPFLVGTWKGHKLYGCPKCQYTTVQPNGVTIMYQHLGQVHHVVEISKVLAPNGKPLAKVRER